EETVLGSHASEEAVQPFTWISLDADHPAAEAARTGAPVFHRDRAEITRRYPHLGPALRQLRLEGNAHLPLRRGAQTLGVFSLSFAEP
ncbi:GAF domain-containing protein, partial [Escherichia coli]|nr:GAF domain-containing protein [Escherichia coli]